jgi:hypothetical protein
MTTSDRFRRAAICQWVFAPTFRIEQITLALQPNVRWSEKHWDQKRPIRGCDCLHSGRIVGDSYGALFPPAVE